MQKLFLVFIIQGCVSLPSDVIMPQWDTDLNVPITLKTYTLNDIIKSQNYISINSQDSTFLISSDSLSQKIAISQFLQFEQYSREDSASFSAKFSLDCAGPTIFGPRNLCVAAVTGHAVMQAVQATQQSGKFIFLSSILFHS